jgi:hypothetical protein
MYLKEIRLKSMKWIQVSWDRVQCRTFVNMVMSLWVSLKEDIIFLSSEKNAFPKRT